jgi:hypothetical protein
VTAAVAAALAALLVLGAVTHPAVLLLAVLVAQGLLVLGWFPALRAPDATGGRLVVAGAAIGADVVVLAGDETRPMAHVAPVLALALLAALAQQLVRRDGRVDLTVSLTATGAAAVLAGLGAAWMALDGARNGTGLMALAAVASAAPPAADLVAARQGAPRWVGGAVAAAVTLLAAVAVVQWTSTGPVLAVSAAAGGAVTARLAVLLGDRATRPQPLLTAALPALLTAPVVYLIGRVLLG